MKKEEFLSIIVPIYNCEKYLKRCINSLLNQNYKNYEIILVNDGSIDTSSKICDKYAKEYENILVIHKKNQGVSSARNDGIKKAKGKYICFLDSDDYVNDGYFEEIDQIIKANPEIQLINFGFFSDVDDLKLNNLCSDVINYKDSLYKTKESIKNDFVSLWDNTMLYNIWNKVYLKDVIVKKRLSFPKYNWGEDVEFNRLYLNNIDSMYNSSKCFYHYVREREGATTKNYNPQIFDIRKKEFQEFNEYFKKWEIRKEEYYEYSCRRYIERILGCIENIYCSKLNFKQKYKEIKVMINDPVTRETLRYANPKSKKINILLIPIKIKSVILTMLMGKIFNIIKRKFPSFFNKLKNRR